MWSLGREGGWTLNQAVWDEYHDVESINTDEVIKRVDTIRATERTKAQLV